jgi:hypothetical protein
VDDRVVCGLVSECVILFGIAAEGFEGVKEFADRCVVVFDDGFELGVLVLGRIHESVAFDDMDNFVKGEVVSFESPRVSGVPDFGDFFGGVSYLGFCGDVGADGAAGVQALNLIGYVVRVVFFGEDGFLFFARKLFEFRFRVLGGPRFCVVRGSAAEWAGFEVKVGAV